MSGECQRSKVSWSSSRCDFASMWSCATSSLVIVLHHASVSLVPRRFINPNPVYEC